MSIESLAAEAAAHWNGRVTRLIRNRENAVFEVALPQGRAALRLHRRRQRLTLVGQLIGSLLKVGRYSADV